MKKHLIYFLMVAFILSLFGGILIFISGCGGGVASGIPGDNPTPKPTTKDPGTFNVTIKVPKYIIPAPGSSSKLTSSIVPATTQYLHVTIQTEATTPAPIEGILDLTLVPGYPLASYTLTVHNVPVGLNIAKIAVEDSTHTLLAVVYNGFFMPSAGNVNAGSALAPLHLGVTIDAATQCDPANIRVPLNTVLYYQNLDYAATHTVDFAVGPPTHNPISNIPAAIPASEPDIAAIFTSVASAPFDTRGVFNYLPGFGAVGNVSVFQPQLNSIVDGDNNNFDPNDAAENVTFTLHGLDFGPDQATVGGVVTFYDAVNFATSFTAGTFTGWTDTQIDGTVNNLPGGKYYVVVTAYGINSVDPGSPVNYFKGHGDYNVWVDKH